MSDRLSEHFTWAEATITQTGLDNTPHGPAREAVLETALFMDGVRSLFGRPIEVTSWYRSPEVNRAVGGSRTSDHMTGYAVDFRVRGIMAHDAAQTIIASPLMFDQLIWYPPFHPAGQTGNRLHISAAPASRRMVLTRNKGNDPMYRQGI